jgi:hypothetical protein
VFRLITNYIHCSGLFIKVEMNFEGLKIKLNLYYNISLCLGYSLTIYIGVGWLIRVHDD